jgi:hypothetical protein
VKHLDDGTLRRMLDEPLSMRETERLHYRACGDCRDRQASIALDARAASELLDLRVARVDPFAALERVKSRIELGNIKPVRHPRLGAILSRPGLRQSLVAAIATLAIVGTVAWTPAGSLAQRFVTIFQPSQITSVQITSTDLKSLAELSKYGTFSLPKQLPMVTVPDAATASTQAHMQVLALPSLPAGVPANHVYEVLPGDSASFTFSAAKAQAAARAEGTTAPPMPAKIDGSTLTVIMRAGVVAVYGSKGDIPGLVIGQMKAPRIKSSGVSVKELEDYVLSIPGISAQLAAQIRSIGDLTKTLPVPVVLDRQQAQQVQVQGVQGLGVGDQTGVGSGVLWEKHGVIYGVAGPMTVDQVVAVANSLR